MNTNLEDIAAVIGFSATLKLVAWFGGGSTRVYVPAVAEDGQLLPRLIGMAAAKQLSKAWPREHIHVPTMHNYGVELRNRHIARMTQEGCSVRDIAAQLQISERRVYQIADDLRSAGLLVAHKEAQASRGKGLRKGRVEVERATPPPGVVSVPEGQDEN